MKYKYLEIVKYSTGKAVSRIDVSSLTERQVEKLDRGMNINLNHSDFYTREVDSKVKLKIGTSNLDL